MSFQPRGLSPAFRQAIRDPWIWVNLVLRLVLIFWVLHRQNWLGGDSHYYLTGAQNVCGGSWGGDRVRTPLYLWYLCALSPNISDQASTTALILPLLVQTLAIWGAGLFLRVRFHRWIALFWLFDPALLAYSNLVMSDACFSLAMLFVALQILPNRSVTVGRGVTLGIALAVAMLARPIGGVAGFFGLFFFALEQRKKLAPLLACLVVLGALIAPRLYWNQTRYHFFGLSSQAQPWIETIAGAVEANESGVDFFQAEKKWFEDHSNRGSGLAYAQLLKRWPTWFWLSFKGAARVLFGHVNVEWSYLVSGVSPIGPGWFKVPEAREGPRVGGAWVVPWVLGLLLTLSQTVFVYVSALSSAWKKSGGRLGELCRDGYSLWALGSVAILAVMPQIFGDARFRTALWPVVLVWWGFNHKKGRAKQ